MLFTKFSGKLKDKGVWKYVERYCRKTGLLPHGTMFAGTSHGDDDGDNGDFDYLCFFVPRSLLTLWLLESVRANVSSREPIVSVKWTLCRCQGSPFESARVCCMLLCKCQVNAREGALRAPGERQASARRVPGRLFRMPGECQASFLRVPDQLFVGARPAFCECEGSCL